MPRIERIDIGDHVYHVLNRANARATIFDDDADYKLFESLLEEGVEKFDMRLLAYCLMPNHFHLVLYPKQDGDLQKFMGWLTNAHTRRWHTIKGTIGEGHLYQGRYKSFLVEENRYLLTLIRYVERNAKKANLVRKAELWKWGSAWRREYGTAHQNKILSLWPIPCPRGYISWLNEPQTASEEEAIERSEQKSIPFGSDTWTNATVKKYGLEQTLRAVGRPRKGG